MSSRQAKKELQKNQQSQDIQEILQAAQQEEKLLKKPTKSAFASFAVQDSSEESEEVEIPKEQPKALQKPKKKRNKRKKNAKDSDEEFLNKVIQEVNPIQKSGKLQIILGDSVLRMDRQFFNYRKELRTLFQQLQAGNTQQIEEKKEERKQDPMADMAGLNKKQKRMYLLQEKLRSKTKAIMTKRQVLCQPDTENWPRIDPTLVRMVQQDGSVFTFKQSPQYRGLQREFAIVQQTMDIHQLIQFLQRNFYHHESLVYFADFLRLQGRFAEAADFLDRCLYAFENSFSFDFQFVQRGAGKEQDAFFMPKIEMDLSPNCEPLNKTFCECLIKYIDILGRKGCNRTAMEFCKLLLGLSPRDDPYGVLLRYDFYAIRAKEYETYVSFVRQFCAEVHKTGALSVIMPNCLLSCGVAKHITSPEISNNDPVALAIQQLKQMESIEEMLEMGPEALISAGCLLYPDLVQLLIQKVAKQQLNSDVRKSYFKGMQAKTWTQILQHSLFADADSEMIPYEWVSDNDDTEHQKKIKSLVYSIYIERSSVLFSSDLNLLWLKQIIGNLLNSIDDGEIDQIEFISKVVSLVDSPSPFVLERYAGLKIADFTEDVTTINPADLLGNGDQPNQPPAQQQAQHEAMIQQVIQQLNQPAPLVPQQQNMMMNQGGLIQQIDPEIAAALDPEELEELQAQLMQGMVQEEFEEWGSEDEDDQQDAQNQGFLQNLLNQFNQWRAPEEEKKN